MRAVRHPPGRAGRLWLIQRLASAERASGILERKHQALELEERRLAVLAERTTAEWENAVGEAERWLQRAAIISGRRALEFPVQQPARAEARFVWMNQMGVEYPATAECLLGDPAPVLGSAAYTPAQEAYRRAVTAAVDQAAAQCALQRVRNELATTLERLRAVRDVWIPAVDAA
ncbi:MAG TPA: V-type ATP synthase subunit D, partial [Actinomycetota bacterium]|nr:V-type ATP synthase subunit D [Actinomycetota bacterium]